MTYTEVHFKRVETRLSDTSLKVSFERTKTGKIVNVTEEQANILNAGKTTHPGNTLFSLLLKEGDKDPEDQILEMKRQPRNRQ